MIGILKLAMAVLACTILAGAACPLMAQEPPSPGSVRLWVDRTTGQVFIKPGRDRVLMTIPGADTAAIEKQVEQKVEARTQAQEAQTKSRLQADNAVLAQQVAEMRPAWRDYIDNFQDKFRIGTLFYGDYRFYTHTGFGPQELTQLTAPGPGNDNYNSFDITRTYLNFYFFPTEDWTLRLTPNMYKTIGSSNDHIGKVSGFGSNLDGNLGVRMKYAYLQYAGLWNAVPALKGGTISLGETANPLVAWEEDLYGFRYVNLTPWNYLSLSSTQTGIEFEGPVRLFGGEKTYLEYGAGVFTNASFHAFEQTDTKQVMARLTVYPFGANWRFQGLGLTGFYNYGYGNTTPDTVDISTPLKGANAHITRIAALLHYTAEQWGLAGEFDYGNNAFSSGNLYSSSGPADAFGTPTGTPFTGGGSFFGNSSCSAATPCYDPRNSFGPFTALTSALLGNGRTRNIGFDVFGHYHIPDTKLTAFGMFQWFMPNDNVPLNPLDFQRFIVGVSYQYNEYLRFALNSQNLLFYHNQFSFPVSEAAKFNYIPGSKLNGLILPGKGSSIPNVVPRDNHSIFLNMEFSY
ncbi:MAG: hypothetical protein ACREQN_11075 [Candidatus Binataceae bacterium]